jgi:hypothetical protein
MRTIVAVLALGLVRLGGLQMLEGSAYKNPRERIKMTENFVRGVIFIFHTKNTGRIPKDQSVTALIAAWA